MTRHACSTLALALLLTACGSSSSGGDNAAGGSSAAGGSTSAGGSAQAGGSTSMGGGTSAGGGAGAAAGGTAGAAGSTGGSGGAPAIPDIPADGQITWVASEPGIGTSTYSAVALWAPVAGPDVEVTGTSPATSHPMCTLDILKTMTPAVGTYPLDGVIAGGFCGSTDVVYGIPTKLGTSSGTLTITSFDGTILKGTATFEANGIWSAAPGGAAMVHSTFAVAFAAKK